jgi:hypothetical protein
MEDASIPGWLQMAQIVSPCADARGRLWDLHNGLLLMVSMHGVQKASRMHIAPPRLVAAAGYALLQGDRRDHILSLDAPWSADDPCRVALTAPPLMTALLSCVDRSRSGMASEVLNTFRLKMR